jgi:hypothetical protein
MSTEILNLTVEPPAKNADLEKAVRVVAVKIVKTLELFSAQELREEPEAISSFTSLVNALCRLSERALKNQQYHDSLEPSMRGRKKLKKGLPTDLIEQMHEELNLL